MNFALFIDTRHHRRALRARCLVFYFLFFLLLFFLINCNNNLLLMHTSINCHLLTPQWQLLTKLGQRENQSASRKSIYNLSILTSRFSRNASRFNISFFRKDQTLCTNIYYLGWRIYHKLDIYYLNWV